MPRRLPSLNALKAFEAAARHESFTRAADELCVTRGAVSHQVKALEAELGFPLFHRERQRLVITEAGRAAAERRRPHRHHVAELRRQVAGAPPRPLRRGPSEHRPTYQRVAAPRRLRARGRRRRGPPRRRPVARAGVTRLCTEALFPVCSPRLLRGRDALREPFALRHHVLLHLDDRRDWAKWLEAAGVDGADLARGPVFQPGEHGDRRRRRRSGRGARAHRVRRLGPSRRPPRAPPVRPCIAGAIRLLDRLPAGDRRSAEDRRVPRLAGRRGQGGCAAAPSGRADRPTVLRGCAR